MGLEAEAMVGDFEGGSEEEVSLNLDLEVLPQQSLSKLGR